MFKILTIPVHCAILASEAVIGGDEVASVELDPGLVSEALQPPAWIMSLDFHNLDSSDIQDSSVFKLLLII